MLRQPCGEAESRDPAADHHHIRLPHYDPFLAARHFCHVDAAPALRQRICQSKQQGMPVSANIAEMERRREAAKMGGGAKRIEAQHAKGKLTGA